MTQLLGRSPLPPRPGLRYADDGSLLVDVRGPRFGAAVTTLVLALALLLRGPAGTVLLAWQVVAFATSVVAGLAWSPYGELFRRVKRRLDLGPPPAVESEAPPRFAQLCGLVVGSSALVAVTAGSTTLGWSLVAVVLALSTLLATTGLCVGCEVYLLAARVRALRGRGSAAAHDVGGDGLEPAVQARLGLDPALPGPRAVLFGSPTCSPCDTVKAVLDDVRSSERPDLQWSYVDAADHLDVADAQRIRRVPTLLVLDDAGEVVSRASGVPARGELLEALEKAA